MRFSWTRAEMDSADQATLAKNVSIIREEASPECYLKARYVLALMGFLGNFNLYCLRINLSVAIVAMVNSTQTEISNSNGTTCPERGGPNVTSGQHESVFDWNSAEQGLLLGIYFYGYVLTCIPGGYLGTRLGVRRVFGISMLASSILTLLFPLVAHASFPVLLVVRFLVGFLQGVCSPCMQSAWSKWAPPLERSILISFTLSGSSFGSFITLPVAALVADTLGWEAVFYVTGGGALLWSVIWLAIIHSSPQNHPRISKEEKAYIINSIRGTQEGKKGRTRTPWLAILTSPPVWAVVAGHFCCNWGTATLIAMLPTYMATVLRFDLSTSGVLSAIPFLLQFLFAFGGGYVTDVIRTRHIMTTLGLRKLNMTLALVMPAIFLVLAGYIGCDVSFATAFFALAVAFGALHVPGCLANTADIAPKYCGIIFGLSNTVANCAGFLAPQVVGLMLLTDDSLAQWQRVFYMVAGVSVTGASIFLFLASADEQSWASGQQITPTREKGENDMEELSKMAVT